MKTIWLSRMARTMASTLSETACGVRLFTTTVFATAPTRSNARAESYSQLVPGNTGITTRGLAKLAPAVWRVGVMPAFSGSNEMGAHAGPSALPRYGYTPESAFSQGFCRSFWMDMRSPQA